MYTMRKKVNSGFLYVTKPLCNGRILRKKIVIRVRNDYILSIYLTSFFKHRFDNNVNMFHNLEFCLLVFELLPRSKCYLMKSE